MSVENQSKRMTITEADNCFIVSQYKKDREEQIVCKNKEEMMNAVHKMMGMKEMEESGKKKVYHKTSDGKMKMR